MKKVLIFLIKIYQRMPINMHGYCNFYPTCSDYAIMALNEYGAFKGSLLTIKRLFKCNPFTKGGYDPLERK